MVLQAFRTVKAVPFTIDASPKPRGLLRWQECRSAADLNATDYLVSFAGSLGRHVGQCDYEC